MARKMNPKSLENLNKRVLIQHQKKSHNGRYKNIFTLAKEDDFSQEDILKAYRAHYRKSEAELREIRLDPGAPAIIKTLCGAILKDIEDGTFKALDSLMDRKWGKPRQITELEGGLNLTPPPIIIEGDEE
jgi:hypothetical protein